MPSYEPDSGPDNENELAAHLAQIDVRSPRVLTPEEMRLLAEKLYAMLHADVRSMQARRQEPPLRR